MTAILGFSYLGGYIMLGDTEETIGYTSKCTVYKLHTHVFPKMGHVVTGGSGGAEAIDWATQKLEQFLSQQQDTDPKLYEKIETWCAATWKNLTEPYVGLPPDILPDFTMLIALNQKSLNTGTRLLFWDKNMVREIEKHHHFCIGSGQLQIKPMLGELDLAIPFEAALVSALRVMLYAKRYVQGVGGKTEVIALRDDGSRYHLGSDKTEKIEAMIANFEEFTQRLIYPTIFGIHEGIAELEENTKQFLDAMPQIFQMYRDEFRKILKPSEPHT